jgi:hypothetical protein
MTLAEDGSFDQHQIVERITARSPVTLDSASLDGLLEAAEIIRDEDTGLAGRIRILVVEGTVMVQEQNEQGRILVRRLDSEDAAQRLVDDRLATYERMWDGCGCTIDYGVSPEDR